MDIPPILGCLDVFVSQRHARAGAAGRVPATAPQHPTPTAAATHENVLEHRRLLCKAIGTRPAVKHPAVKWSLSEVDSVDLDLAESYHLVMLPPSYQRARDGDA
jgi:hypothetical protein